MKGIAAGCFFLSIISLLPGISVGQAPAPLLANGLAQFAGAWTCSGSFASNGTEIHSSIRMTWSEQSNAMLVQHDDDIPFKFHAKELWTSHRPQGLSAMIADPYSGARLFVSDGVLNGQLVWQREENGKLVERFRYVLDTNRHLKVDWLTSHDGATFTLGDSLSCVSSEASWLFGLPVAVIHVWGSESVLP